MEKQKKSVKETVQRDMPDFADEVAGKSVEELNDRLAVLAKNQEELQQAKEADEALEQARAAASELAAPYREGKKALVLKTRYIIGLIKEKGGE